MERVLGIGGYFMRAADPVALSTWYRDCLGLDADENGLWLQEAGPTVFATFESQTDYFGSSAQQTMLNFRVRDLDAMLAQLREKGATWSTRLKTWRASVGSAGSRIPRAIASSCGSLSKPIAIAAALTALSSGDGSQKLAPSCEVEPVSPIALVEPRTTVHDVPARAAPE
jgi:hypothetical protein